MSHLQRGAGGASAGRLFSFERNIPPRQHYEFAVIRYHCVNVFDKGPK